MSVSEAGMPNRRGRQKQNADEGNPRSGSRHRGALLFGDFLLGTKYKDTRHQAKTILNKNYAMKVNSCFPHPFPLPKGEGN